MRWLSGARRAVLEANPPAALGPRPARRYHPPLRPVRPVPVARRAPANARSAASSRALARGGRAPERGESKGERPARTDPGAEAEP
jgi:hypothetical protein